MFVVLVFKLSIHPPLVGVLDPTAARRAEEERSREIEADEGCGE